MTHNYQKINGTLITIEPQSDDGVYEYDNFPPIPFQAGDILLAGSVCTSS